MLLPRLRLWSHLRNSESERICFNFCAIFSGRMRWVEQQFRQGVNPLHVLRDLMPDLALVGHCLKRCYESWALDCCSPLLGVTKDTTLACKQKCVAVFTCPFQCLEVMLLKRVCSGQESTAHKIACPLPFAVKYAHAKNTNKRRPGEKGRQKNLRSTLYKKVIYVKFSLCLFRTLESAVGESRDEALNLTETIFLKFCVLKMFTLNVYLIPAPHLSTIPPPLLKTNKQTKTVPSKI